MTEKEERLSRVYEILDNLTLNSGKDLSELVSNETISEITIAINEGLKISNFDTVTDFNDTFEVEREKDYDVQNFKHKKLRVALILEETFELAFALGMERGEIYTLTLDMYNKQRKKAELTPLSFNGKIKETFDAILDLLVVVYGAANVFNFDSAVREGMGEVYFSNMSKVCKNREELVATIAKYRKEGILLNTMKTADGKFIVKNRDTGKLLKSISYKEPQIKELLINHKIIKDG